MKRVKSFFIILGSMALTAFVAVLPTIEFANFLVWVKDVVVGWGVPMVVWAVFASFVAQLWFAWRNRVIIAKAVRNGLAARASSFEDTENELY